MTPEQLKGIVREAVREELARRDNAPSDGLVSQREICKALRISRSKLFELVGKGMPQHRLGAHSPRYDASECVAWIKGNA